VVAKAPANFTVETFGAGDGELAIKYGPVWNHTWCLIFDYKC
jgi:hypothetical protein